MKSTGILKKESLKLVIRPLGRLKNATKLFLTVIRQNKELKNARYI